MTLRASRLTPNSIPPGQDRLTGAPVPGYGTTRPPSAATAPPASRLGRSLSRFRLLLDAYGLAAAQRREVAEAIIANHDWDCAIIAEGVRAGHAGFIDAWKRTAAG